MKQIVSLLVTSALFLTVACGDGRQAPAPAAVEPPAAVDAQPPAPQSAAETPALPEPGGPAFVCSTQLPPGLAERIEQLDRVSPPAPGFQPELALVKDYVWGPNAALRVRFLDGDPAIRKKVQAVATKWMTETTGNFRFVFDQSASAQIRISFDPRTGSWSYIGNSSRPLGANVATMNFGWLNAQTPDVEYNRVVLHEFGHALGAIHEHQNPAINIKWNEPAVIAYYKQTNGWTEEMTRRNIFTKYAPAAVKNSQFDPSSIMLYSFPASFTLPDSSVRETRSNTSLSTVDKEMIQRLYPPE